MRLVPPEGFEPSTLDVLGPKLTLRRHKMADGGGIEPLTGTSRYACVRNRLDHLITHHPNTVCGGL